MTLFRQVTLLVLAVVTLCATHDARADGAAPEPAGVAGDALASANGATDLATGAPRASVSFDLPAPRGTAASSLGLAYGGAGEAGAAWGLAGMASIERRNVVGPPKYNDPAAGQPFDPAKGDRFVWGGQTLAYVCTVSVTSCPSRETQPAWRGWHYFRLAREGAFARFYWAPDGSRWGIQWKSGVTEELGGPWTASELGGYAAEVDAAGKSPPGPGPFTTEPVQRWHLVRRYDSARREGKPANVIVYRWDLRDALGRLYLTDIYDTRCVSCPSGMEGDLGTPTPSSYDVFAHHVALAYEEHDEPLLTATWQAHPSRAPHERRLRTVTVTSAPFEGGRRELVRRYWLRYATMAHRSYLTTVTLEGRCETPRREETQDGRSFISEDRVCPTLPPTRFEYTPFGSVPTTSSTYMDQHNGPTTWSFVPSSAFVPMSGVELVPEFTAALDVDADGLPDLVQGLDPAKINPLGGAYAPGGPPVQVVALNKYPSLEARRLFAATHSLAADLLTNKRKLSVFGDWEVTGRGAILHRPLGTSPQGGSVFLPFDPYEVVRDGDDFRWVSAGLTRGAPDHFQNIADVDGDGSADVRVFNSGPPHQPSGPYTGSYEAYAPTQASASIVYASDTMSGGNAPDAFTVRSYLQAGDQHAAHVRPRQTFVADMNGDGVSDLVAFDKAIVIPSETRVLPNYDANEETHDEARTPHEQLQPELYKRYPYWPSYRLVYWPGDGRGRFECQRGDGCGPIVDDLQTMIGDFSVSSRTPARVLEGASFETRWLDRTYIHDVNGDGLADVVAERTDGTCVIDVFFNRDGRSFAPPLLVVNPVRESDGSCPVMESKLLIADMNASGTDDLVIVTRHKKVLVLDLGGVEERAALLRRVTATAGMETTFSYANLALLGLAKHWAGIPSAMPIVAEITVKNGPGLSGPAYQETRTTYDYDSPVYDAVERRFFGFKKVSVTEHGNRRAPTSTVDTYFHFDDCLDVWSGCARGAAARWRDERRFSSGRPWLREVRAGNVFLSTTQWTYRKGWLPELPSFFAYPEQTDTFLYDTSPFKAGTKTIEVVVLRPRGDALPTSTTITLRSDAFDHLRTSQIVDDVGNVTTSTDYGRVQEDGAPIDQTIITTRKPIERVPGAWIWRTESSVTAPFTARGGAPQGLPRSQRYEYNDFGQLTDVYAELDGTLPLDRSHEDPRKAISLAAPNASALGSHEIRLEHIAPDPWGNAVLVQMPNARCTMREYDPLYQQFVIAEHGFPGKVCGQNPVTTRYQFDRGLGVSTLVTAPDGSEVATTYDGLGRTWKVFGPDPTTGTTLSEPLSILTYSYFGGVVEVQGLTRETGGNYRETRAYADGRGRMLELFTQAEPSATGAPRWIASGLVERVKGSTVVAYAPVAIEGDPRSSAFTFQGRASLGGALYDPFGRVIQTIARDGEKVSRVAYHGLATEAHDAASMRTGGLHANTPSWTYKDGHGRVIGTKKVLARPTRDELLTEVDYLATGETARVVQRHTAGSAERVERWSLHDGLGRKVLNVESNTSVHFASPDLASLDRSDDNRLRAWRYAYNDSGELVGTSDARGCGKDIHYDGLGRVRAEDYSPCTSTQADYTAPNTTTGEGTEAFYRYDGPSPGSPLWTSVYLSGRLTAVHDRASETFPQYDARGRAIGVARRLAQPGTPAASLAVRYATHTFQTSTRYDEAGRVESSSLGVDVPELLGPDGASDVRYHYGARGLVESIDGSYGALVTRIDRDVEGDVTSVVYGDAAQTIGRVGYDGRKRANYFELKRSPALLGSGAPPTPAPFLLEASKLHFDEVGNILQVEDLRKATEWPAGAQPVTRTATYDDLYRVETVGYRYPNATASAPGFDAQVPPFQAEDLAGHRTALPERTLGQRLKTQTYAFDWKGNLTGSTDDASAFFDRSLGAGDHDDPVAPNRLVRAKGGGPAGGDLGVHYDAAGNITELVVQRAGACATCSHRFVYEWDEVGQLARAQRWDFAFGTPPPTGTPSFDVAYAYDASGMRVRRSVTAEGETLHDVEVFGSLRLDHAAWLGTDYQRDGLTESASIGGLARVVTVPDDIGEQVNGKRRVFFTVGDHLGSTSTVLDKESSELVEHVTYSPYGQVESDYRIARWGSYRERYRFTGKEDDLEVGLSYFGARYFHPALGRFISPDPLAIHGGGGDPNPYAYVRGRVYNAIDPNGLDGEEATPWTHADALAAWGWEPPAARGQVTFGASELLPQGAGAATPARARAPKPPTVGELHQERYEAAKDGLWNRIVGAVASVATFAASFDAENPEEAKPKVTIEAIRAPVPQVIPGDIKGMVLVDNYNAGGDLAEFVGVVATVDVGPILESAGVAGRAVGVAVRAAEVFSPAGGGASRAYSVAAEVRLPGAAWGRSAAVHENVANAMLHDGLVANPAYRSAMEGLIPGVTESVASVGGRATPAGWIWHHELASGLMRLVPQAQHTPGSAFWGVLHPNGFGGYASWARAFGAPPR